MTSTHIEQYCVEGEDGTVLIQMKVPAAATSDLKEIIGDHLLTWSDLFAYKNAGYGDMADDLGSSAQFVDIHRKTMKLKRAIWEGEELTGEPVHEVINDLIGHLFLMQVQLRKEEQRPDLRVVNVIDTDDNSRREVVLSPEPELSGEMTPKELREAHEVSMCSTSHHMPHWRNKSIGLACPGA